MKIYRYTLDDGYSADAPAGDCSYIVRAAEYAASRHPSNVVVKLERVNAVKIGGRVYGSTLSQRAINKLLVNEKITRLERKDVEYMEERITTWEDCFK